jgi:ABC-2 type transport system ATP-binding protein
MTPVIVAEKLTKRYGSRLAVDGVSFEVNAREVLGLLGPNGSGKSTILRILTGYLRPSSGTARIAGNDVVDQAIEARRRVGYVPEDAPLYTHMRVEEFLAFMGKLKGVAEKHLARAIDQVCERLALQAVRNLSIGKLSRGFRQRTAIAQALLGNPELLVLDEPTNGLDPRQIIEMRDLVRSLAEHHTVLVTSHILGEIEKVAQRVAILLSGRLLAVHSLKSETSDRRLRLRVRGLPHATVEATLRQVPGVRTVRLDGSVSTECAYYVVGVERPEVAETIARALVAKNFGVLEIAEASADLETLFLGLTGEAGR